MAREAGARQLAIFHHDPLHSDDDIDRLLCEARSLDEAPHLDRVLAASEGLSLEVGVPPHRATGYEPKASQRDRERGADLFSDRRQRSEAVEHGMPRKRRKTQHVPGGWSLIEQLEAARESTQRQSAPATHNHAVPGRMSVSDAPAASGVSPSHFREVLGHFASGLTIVTAVDDEGPVGFTCQAFMSLSLDPPLIAIAPSKASTSWPRISSSGDLLCEHVMAEDQEALCRDFAISGRERSDKFSGVGWRPGEDGVPVLDGALAWVVCRIAQSHEAGDHELVVGRGHRHVESTTADGL